MAGKCKAGHYTTNIMVTRRALVCHGGYGQPQCVFLEKCCRENGYRMIKKKRK